MAAINRNRFLLILIFFFLNNSEVLCIEKKTDSLNRLLKTTKGIEKIDILNELSTVYDTISYIKSLDYANQALKLTIKYKKEEDIAGSLDKIGRIQYFMSNYDKSIDYFLESLKIREKIGNKKDIAQSYNNLGVIYLYLANYNKALEYFQKAWDISEGVGDVVFIMKLSNNLGIVYMKLANYDKALEYFQKTLNNCIETNNKQLWGPCLSNIGIVYWYLEDYKKALEYYLDAIKICEETGDKWSVSNSSRNIGEVYIKLQDYNNSLLYLNKGLKIAKEINSKHLIKDCCVTFSELYYAKGSYKKAYEYQQLYSEIKDSIFSEETGKNIAEMEVKFETEKKEKEILQQKKVRNIYFIAFVLFVSAIITVFIEYRKKNSAYKFLVKKNIDLLNKEKELKNVKEKVQINNTNSQNIVPDDKKEKILENLEILLDCEKIYINPDLTLNKLAKHLSTNRVYLSQIINDEFGGNFSDFINEYRVKEAMLILSDPKKIMKFSIEAIAQEAGFNSKSSFNFNFKKYTGITPSNFKENINGFFNFKNSPKLS